MAAKHQKIVIKVPERLNKAQRIALGVNVVDFIINRTTKQGLDKNNNPFPKHRGSKTNPTKGQYSAQYVDSVDFKAAGKSAAKITMELSGDMLDAIEILNVNKKGEITIGYRKGTEQNAKADGNIRGTYGHSKPIQPGREFLGIHKDDLKKLADRFKSDKSAIIQEEIISAVPSIKETITKNKRALKRKGGVTEFDAINLNLSLEELEALENKINGG